MMKNLPPEAFIAQAIQQSNCSIFTSEDVILFLKNESMEKNQVERFLCYCIALGIVPAQRNQFVTTLAKRVDEYIKQIKLNSAKNQTNPLKNLPVLMEDAIRGDLEKSLSDFQRHTKKLGNVSTKVNDIILRIHRIFFLMWKKNSEWFHYSSGFDRIIIAIFSFTCFISEQMKVDLDFAEAFTFLISSRLLLIDITIFPLSDQPKITNFFGNIDDAVRVCAPSRWSIMQNEGSSPLSIALEWSFMLFSSEHSGNDLLFIWDQLIGRIDQIWEMMQSLIVAHLMNAPLNTEKLFSDVARGFNSWDVQKIVTDALAVFNHKRSFIEELCLYCCPSMKKLHGYAIKVPVSFE